MTTMATKWEAGRLVGRGGEWVRGRETDRDRDSLTETNIQTD